MAIKRYAAVVLAVGFVVHSCGVRAIMDRAPVLYALSALAGWAWWHGNAAYFHARRHTRRPSFVGWKPSLLLVGALEGALDVVPAAALARYFASAPADPLLAFTHHLYWTLHTVVGAAAFSLLLFAAPPE